MLLGQTFCAVIDSLQKIVITNGLQLIYNIIYWGFMLFALFTGHSLDVIGIGLLSSSIIWFLLIVVSFYKIWGRIEIRDFKINFLRISKKQINFGFQVYASGIVSLFYEPLTKILISNFLGVKDVGFFDIALKVRNQFQGVVSKIYYPLLPHLAKTTDFIKLRMIVHDIEQKAFIILPPFLVSIIFCSDSFINIWIGKDTSLISFGVKIILCSFIVRSFTVIPFYQYLLTKKPCITIVLQVTNVVVNVLVFMLLYRYLAFYSIFLAYAVAILFSFSISLLYQYKILNSLIFDSFNQLSKMILVFLICFILGYVYSLFVSDNLFVILFLPIILFSVSILLIKFFNLVKEEDIKNYLSEKTKLYNITLKMFVRN